MHTEGQRDIHNFVLSEAQNISLLLRFLGELLLNPTLPSKLPLCCFISLHSGAAFVQY